MVEVEFCFSFISGISVSFRTVRFVLLMFSSKGEVGNANQLLLHFELSYFCGLD